MWRYTAAGIPIDEVPARDITEDEWIAARTAHARRLDLVMANPVTRAIFKAATAEIDEHQAKLTQRRP